MVLLFSDQLGSYMTTQQKVLQSVSIYFLTHLFFLCYIKLALYPVTKPAAGSLCPWHLEIQQGPYLCIREVC